MAEVTTEEIELAREETEEVGVTSQAISGNVTLIGNCAGQDDRIRLLVALAGWYGPTWNLGRCLARGIFTYDDWSFPERVQAEIRAWQTTQVECVPNILDAAGNPTGFTGQAFARADGTEYLKLATNRLPLFTDQVLVGLIYHEVSHNRFYGHPESDANIDHAFSIPQHLLACGAAIHGGTNPALPAGRDRYSFISESTTAPVGGGGGSPFSRGCFFGQRMAGLSVRTGAHVDAIGARCRSNPIFTPVLNYSTVGGGGGSPANLDCAANEVLVGVYGDASNTLLTRVGPICASITDVTNGATGPNIGDPQFPSATLRYRTAAGAGGGGHSFERICPSFMVAEGLQGRAGGAIDRLELFCQRLDRQEMIAQTWLTKLGGNGGGMHSDRCVGRSALVGLTTDITPGLVARLGGICTEVTTGCIGTTCFEMAGSGAPHVMGSHGGSTFNAANQFNDQCAANQALVGVNVRSGSLVDAIGGICADVVAWSLPPNVAAAPTNDLTIRGGAGGTLHTRTCPRGEFLTGWELRSGSLIDSVQPVCRRFD